MTLPSCPFPPEQQETYCQIRGREKRVINCLFALGIWRPWIPTPIGPRNKPDGKIVFSANVTAIRPPIAFYERSRLAFTQTELRQAISPDAECWNTSYGPLLTSDATTFHCFSLKWVLMAYKPWFGAQHMGQSQSTVVYAGNHEAWHTMSTHPQVGFEQKRKFWVQNWTTGETKV